ncbi:MAG: MgtC/SapB family protein [Spirochaetales bacterium]|nr:MgtC/SapB family protein [Spirochaetales bacterium]
MDDYVLIFIKIAWIFFFSFIFGISRQLTNKPIGFGTFIFVATGSCALAAVGLDITEENPLPLFGSIVTGIGFLGAGALIRNVERVSGFTNAATIWIFAILGIIVGAGYFLVSLFLFLVILLVVSVDAFLSRRNFGYYRRKLVVNFSKLVELEAFQNLLPEVNIKHYELSVDIDNSSYKYIYFVHFKKSNLNLIFEKLTSLEGIKSFHLE